MLQKHLLIAFVVIGSCQVHLFAQTGGPQLTLQDARALALKNHPQILGAQSSYLRAYKIITETKSAYYPTINGNITGSQASQSARLGAGALNAPRLFTRFGYGLSISQLVTDSGRTPNLVASSKFSAQASQENYRATRYDVILGVDQAYYQVLLAQQLVTVARQTVAARQTVVNQVSQLVKNKLKSEVDLSFAQVNLADANLMLIRAQDQLEGAYAGLAQALGTDQAIHYRLADQPMPPIPPATVDPLIAEAYRDRPELAGLRLQQQADRKFAYAERDLKRPTVSVLAVGGSLPLINPANANPYIPEGYEGAALNVQIPIFNGHLFTARRQAAEFQLATTNQRFRDEQDRIAKDVRAAWAHARTSYEAISTTQVLMQQANLAFDLAQGRYNLGLASIVELTQAQLGQTSAQVENLNARYEYQIAYAALQYTLGALH